ncbi:MAG TPA: hypothetical protein VEL72_06340 [Ktedonobacteraceae bacterium]|nr:hypothetical protein [Ktedonobacteraceae bacterium]
MKCSSCGLPLSPSRANANCPRCGASPDARSNGSKSTGNANPPDPGSYELSSWGGNDGGGVPLGAVMSPPNGQWGQGSSEGQWAPSSYNPSLAQANAPQAVQPEQMWLPGPAAAPTISPKPITLQRPTSPRFPQPPGNNRNMRIGFLVAGLCIVAGGLLLVFVYFMAIGTGNNTGNAGNATSTVPSPTGVSSPTTTSSPTATVYPGSQFIDNAQASSTAPTGSQPGQPVTTFKVNQKFYVSFNLHTGGQKGAVCLLWYLNGKQAFTSSFAIGANTKFSFAYAIYGSSGPAYVELYWASTITCADKMQAQHVDFTITP